VDSPAQAPTVGLVMPTRGMTLKKLVTVFLVTLVRGSLMETCGPQTVRVVKDTN